MSRSDLTTLLVFISLVLARSAAAQEPAAVLRAEDERSYLLRRQQEIFRLNVETDYALALQKLCQTGYGDPRLCQQAAPKPAAAPPIAPSETPARMNDTVLPGKVQAGMQTQPSVQEISGLGVDLTAILLYADGRRVTVRAPLQGEPGRMLPGGAQVVAVEARRVILRTPAHGVVSLPLDGNGADVGGGGGFVGMDR
jgi:type IV pilus biogenesis protein PilP